jgi:hypothetical protein
MTFPSANILLLKKKTIDPIKSTDVLDQDIPGTYTPTGFERIVKNSIEVSNAAVETYFTNRATYINATKPHIDGSSEYLTGIYQQPDLGTYAGNINALTETQITNLANGNDEDGLGDSVSWSILEKVWILENLRISASDNYKRYGFRFQNYDSGISNIFVVNSGALGVVRNSLLNAGGIGETDWVDSNTDGLADDFNKSGDYTASRVTGNGFVGNAQRLEKPTGTYVDQLYSSYFDLPAGTYKMKLKHRCSNTLAFTFQLPAGWAPSTNTGNAIVETSTAFTWAGGSYRLDLICFNVAGVQYIEIDEVEFIDITEDWVDTDVDGFADGYSVGDANITGFIVTGNGFFENAQRIVAGNTTGASFMFRLVQLEVGKSYKVVGKFRCSSIGVGTSRPRIFVQSNPNTVSLYPANNTGDALNFETDTFVAGTANSTIGYSMTTANNGDWLEVDEIEIIEV